MKNTTNTTKRNSMKKVSAILAMVMAMSTAASTMAVTASAFEVVAPAGSSSEVSVAYDGIADEDMFGSGTVLRMLGTYEDTADQQAADLQTADQTATVQTADQYIKSLSYDKDSICTRTAASTQPTTEYRYNTDGSVTVITRKYESDVKSNSFGISSSVINKIYPGAIVLAGNGLAEGNPSTVTVDRNNCTITVTGLKMKTDENGNTYSASATYNPNGYGSYQAALNSILEHADLSDSQACINYSTEYVSSTEELAAKMKVDSTIIKTLGIEASLNMNSSEAHLVTVVDQKFFTVSADMQQNGQAFADSVTGTDLQEAGISSATPPAMVSSADYGRKLVISYSTADKSIDIQATLKAANAVTSGELSAELKEKLSKIKANVYMYGGSTSAQSKFIGEMDASKINELIRDTTKMTSITDAALTNYSANYLQGGETAVKNDATSCTVTSSNRYGNIPVYFNVNGVSGRVDDFHYTATYKSRPIPAGSDLAKELLGDSKLTHTTDENGNLIFSGKYERNANSNGVTTATIPAWVNPRTLNIVVGYNGKCSSSNHDSMISYNFSEFGGTVGRIEINTNSWTKWWGGYGTYSDMYVNNTCVDNAEG